VQRLRSVPGMTVDHIGTTVQGREISVVRISSSPQFGEDASKLRILLFAQQHGDEPTGKEALTMLLAQCASGGLRTILERCDLLIVPQMNPDGAELGQRRTATYRHSGSVGPRQSTAMVGATLHVLAGDVRFDALSGAILTAVQEEPRSVPAAFGLLWSYPNPFNGTTVLGFRVPGPGAQGVKLTVYDMLGREDRVVVNESRTPGTHTVLFDAAGLSSGVYIVRLESSGRSAAHKLLLLR